LRVHQVQPVAVGAQRLARLRARIVELARLPDDDRAGADDQDRLEISSFWHPSSSRSARTDSRYRAARGSLQDALENRMPACQHAPAPAASRQTAIHELL